ncbi:2-(1,2-epoxy-1,2-dihydrophenyl)acetyl-CoA isomerase [Bacillus sp. AFS076308]|uniref:enoyl-CoA hydratase-related protein n=1 Tax=unclassified Bacillus (in: firmicutes) TaxID=185979 RepID=UPI000BFA42E3|nr:MULTISPECIES: enoyl-CoA hydratase-related protein [unclassified Bacillus (in: firmicutes)]PFO04470.1 2-(1,2-epoxy-1,2-dihydrophenyl)acetyl-CoA isomerase [Bacillus sp. AFS076308]PGV48296.1 2-(1,2-epoxy-1,2-dihydrophenyl)acetyl-CoA isomerase [Bacillus sp. AFS037270]
MYETIFYSVENGVARITLNRPNTLNAFVARMNKEITKAIKAASSSEEVRCIVITGEGRGFCSGQDLSEVDENMDHGQVLREKYGPMIKQIYQCEKPIIAAVNGIAAGAGFSLALACDFRLLSDRASFINAFIHIGLIPDSGNSYFLTRLVGEAKALEISILGEKITADQAHVLGLATKVVSSDNWDAEVNQFAERIAALPTKAVGLIKRTIKATAEQSFTDYLEEEAQGQRIAGLTKDHREGVQAFMEKRKPNFIGK